MPARQIAEKGQQEMKMRYHAIGTVAVTTAIEWQREKKKRQRIYLLFFALNRFHFFWCCCCCCFVLFHLGFENFLWSIELIAFNSVLAFETCYRYLLSIYTPKHKIVGNVDRRSHTQKTTEEQTKRNGAKPNEYSPFKWNGLQTKRKCDFSFWFCSPSK